MTTSLALLMMTCAPLVHPTTLRALIEVESAGNPYAVSINYPQAMARSGIRLPTFRQPKSANAAVRVARELTAHGFGVSVGLAQINVDRLPAVENPSADLFDPCTNLATAQRVLLECDSHQTGLQPASASDRLHRTLACYNAGNYSSAAGHRYALAVTRAATRRISRGLALARSPV
jgi:type IV secretion system protein VirB1